MGLSVTVPSVFLQILELFSKEKVWTRSTIALVYEIYGFIKREPSIRRSTTEIKTTKGYFH
jgi:hypothetical protein